MYQPLADALRPQELSDVCGQQHILGENGLLRRIIESGSVPNMIFYGPSGTGKTTVANLIAKKTQRKLCKLNATTASSADPVFQQKAAADAAGIHRKRQDHAHRVHDGKSVFLCL